MNTKNIQPKSKKDEKKNLIITFIDFLIVAYVASIYILSISADLNFISRLLALALMGILALYALTKGRFDFNGITLIFGMFLAFCLFSCLWAEGQSQAISTTTTLVQLFALIALLNNYLKSEGKLTLLFNAIYFSGILFGAYVIGTIGITAFFEGISAGLRVGQEITNANAVGMTSMATAIIAMWRIFYQKKTLSILPFVLTVLVCLATGSRTALVSLIFGLLVLFVLKGDSKKKIATIFQGALVVVALIVVIQLPMFEPLRNRIDGLIEGLTTEGGGDESTTTRLRMIEVGWEEFLKSPIIGHGIGYSWYMTKEIFGWSTYLHNNYVELLSAVGAIGTTIYYAMFANPLFKLFRKQGNATYAPVIMAILLSTLLTHIGTVAYYNKLVYLYLLFAWLVVGDNSCTEVETNENT